MKFLLFIIILLSNVANSKERIIDIENKNYKVPLPSKFCDFSDTVWGIQLMDLLMKHNKMSSVAPRPQLVYRLCNSNSVEIFPWGYLGTKKNKFIKTQETFNKLKAKVLKSTSLYDKMVKREGKNLSSLFDEYGMNTKNTGYNKPFIVWFDNDVIISSVVSSHIVNKEQYKEKLITADTILNGIIFTYNTFDDKGELGINTKSYTLDLIENAKLFKQIN